MKPLFTFLILFIALSFKAAGQDYFFRQYAHEEGLLHPFVYSVNQDSDGFLWIGTGEGLYRFNGFDFEYFTTEHGMADNFITRIFRDKNFREFQKRFQLVDGSTTFIGITPYIRIGRSFPDCR